MLLKKLETFRQVGAGRKDHNSRSHWSEPDTIRDYTEQALPEHSERKHKIMLSQEQVLVCRLSLNLKVII